MKTIGYLIFSGFYYIFRLFCPVRPKKVFAIMTHDGSRDGNVGAMVEYLKEQKDGYIFHFMKKADRNLVKDFHIMKGKMSFFIVKPYHLATSQYVLLDNIFLPMAYFKFPKKVKVIQLWHGTGTIKRFGQDVNTGRLRELENRANSNITHLIVNSEETKQEYASAFAVPEDRISVLGLPRTDLFFDEAKLRERQESFYEEYPELAGKKLVLYAPTFRDQERDAPRPALDIEELVRELPGDYVIMLRLHPYVAEAYKKEGPSYVSKNIISMSSYRDLNTLLAVAEYLITDYSSIIFEYCLREKPMIFYAYDLEEFSDHGRGFYREYETYVPGPVAYTTKAVTELLTKDQFDAERIKSFIRKNYKYLDGKAAERIYLELFKQA